MTFTQLRYVTAIAKYGSISLAARQLFVTQPSMTTALQDLEKEIGRDLFIRNSRGVQLTDEGLKFLGHAKQILRQMEMLEERYLHAESKQYFAVSTQHYTFTASAFVELVRQYEGWGYEFSLLEERTEKIIENVRTLKSEIGILYLSRFNEAVLRKIFKESKLYFSPLFMVKPHVFIFRDHPLAKKDTLTLEDLEPFPCITFDQGEENSFYYSEEMFCERSLAKHIQVTDRAAVSDLLLGLDAYIITTGILPSHLHGQDIIARPLAVEEKITVGVIRHMDCRMSELGHAYLKLLEKAAKQVITKTK
ncbi:putative LysR family transcriptional regulator [Selenomonas ruminantium subsp. lactilytica TAM6421]|uniref:Putative LysR family transcriptional regulator n=1 Tax=Selenomonas ruminantium subsp. lactilytica (strain NBRC 103574 / TAM6421) TaxID=927704 RepID=I0GUP7_SELRL|nr:LysR family transcriptional regulator [Selenomonas ruminantium]BAL84484.1 putative LysR family transcriptional regulator [Selenomonas ruminantium subsp. lactilytica TAM6421]